MLFELSEIQKQEALIDNLQQSRKNVQDRLIRSYSTNQKSKTCLQDKFSAILKQSALLIHLLRQIEQGVQHKSLLPTILHQKDINKLLYSSTTLPDWFDHVFSKEYQKQKINLEIIANKMYKLHGLGEKNSELGKAHWNVEILLKRYESLTEKELQSLDIIGEVENFEFMYKSCKDIFKNFLDMMAKKVVQFLENTVESTMLYSNQLKKVKSFDDRGFRDVFTSHHSPNLHSPRSIHHQVSNNDSRNTIKVGIKVTSPYQKGKMGDYYLDNQKSRTIQTLKNNSTVESLRQREKANNEYFFRQSQQKNILSDNSLTREIIKSAKSHNGDMIKVSNHSPSKNYIKPQKESKDSSIRSGRSYYDESIALKKHKSSTNLQYHPDTSLTKNYYRNPHPESPKNTVKIQQIRVINKSAIKETSIPKSQKCLHHCPHHDKPLNNHCSKHCDKLCSHEKMLFNDFGVDLTEMNRQYYESRKNHHNQTLNSVRSAGIQSPRDERTSRSRGEMDIYRSRERNFAEISPYLRNSHDKHLDYYQSRGNSTQKENVRFFENRISPIVNNHQPIFKQKTQRSIHQNVNHQPHYRKPRFQSPPVRASQYYYN